MIKKWQSVRYAIKKIQKLKYAFNGFCWNAFTIGFYFADFTYICPKIKNSDNWVKKRDKRKKLPLMVFVEMLLELDLQSPMEQMDLVRYLYNQLQSRHIQLPFPSVDQLWIFLHLKVVNSSRLIPKICDSHKCNELVFDVV